MRQLSLCSLLLPRCITLNLTATSCSQTGATTCHWPHAGDVLEQAVFLSVKLQDDEAFERNYDQLKTYYTDTG